MLWMPIAEGLRALLAEVEGGFAAFAQAAAPVAVTALWQGAVLAFVLGVGLALAQRVRISLAATQRFLLWFGAFLAVAGLPFLPLFTPSAADLPAAAGTGFFAGAAAPSSASAWLRLPQIQLAGRWALAIGALWLMFSLVRVIGLLAHALRLRRLWKSATPVASAVRFDSANSAVPTFKAAELCTTCELDRPAVIGFFAPRILLPEWLFARLTPTELEQVILHETEHLRRRDDWTNLFGKVALVLFPLNPALVWIERKLAREREMACDEGVVRRTQQPCAYAACLTSLAGHALDRRRAHALSLGAFERRSELARRVTTLLARKPSFSPLVAHGFAALIACGLLAASAALARCPRMVAFAPAASPAVAAQEAMQPAGALFPSGDADRVEARPAFARGASGFRAVQTVADLPAHRSISSATGWGDRTSRRATSTAASRNARGEVSMATSQASGAWTAAMPAVQAIEARVPQFAAPQLVVLTTWQEIAASPEASAEVTGDAPGSVSSTDDNEENAGQPAVAIAVTQLVFWITPRPVAMPLVAPAPGFGPSRAQVLHSRQILQLRRPAAPVPAEGWLVLEL